MLEFESKQAAYQYCKDNQAVLSQKDHVEIYILGKKYDDLFFQEKESGQLTNYHQLRQLVDQLEDQKLSMVMSELLINSLKNHKAYETLTEIKDLELDKGKEILYQIKATQDNKFYQLKVIDHFGSLQFIDLIHLFSEKEVQPRTSGKFGAGVGLRLISQYISSLKVVVDSNKKTEVSVVMKKRKHHGAFSFSFQCNR